MIKVIQWSIFVMLTFQGGGWMRRALAAMLALIVVAVWAGTLSAERNRRGWQDADTLKEAFRKAEAKQGRLVSKDIELFDEDGRPFQLGRYLEDGKPLIIGYIYTKCQSVCPLITQSMERTLIDARAEFGDRFNVILVGFDTEKDTPQSLKEFRARYGGDFIVFASGSTENIKRLLSQTGFYYKKREDGMFDHLDMVTVLSPEGRIYKQIFGVRKNGELLLKTLRKFYEGAPPPLSPATLLERVKYLCYRYDPATGRYVFDYSVVAGVLIQLTIIVTIVVLVWGNRIRASFRRLIGRREDG